MGKNRTLVGRHFINIKAALKTKIYGTGYWGRDTVKVEIFNTIFDLFNI
jgi:hypothetical protein